MTTSITRTYHFESAHWLPLVPEEHKCRRLHGHTYIMNVTVTSPLLPNGFLIDFWDLDKVVQPIVDTVDHRCLNDVPGLQNPTAELIAHWFLEKLACVGASEVSIWETRDCFATAKVDVRA